MLETIKIEGIIASLHKTRGKRVVVILHGLGRNRNEDLYLKFGKFLEENGICALRFDFRGMGESEGNSLDFNIFSEVEDVKKVINYLEEDFNSIGLVAHSHTGIVAIIFLALTKFEKVNCCVVWNGVFRPLKFWKRDEIEEIKKKGYLIYRGIKFGKIMYETARQINPKRYLKMVNEPILLIHSKEDKNVPLEESRFAHNLLKNSQLLITEGDHFFSDPSIRKRVFKKTLSWFQKYL